MVIMPHALPGLKRFLQPAALNERMLALVVRWIVTFVMHLGRMAAARAATAVRSEPRHRAQLGRFLGRKLLRRLGLAGRHRDSVLALEKDWAGRFFFLVDQTLTSQSGRRGNWPFTSLADEIGGC
jgi:hypothetical protein